MMVSNYFFNESKMIRNKTKQSDILGNNLYKLNNFREQNKKKVKLNQLSQLTSSEQVVQLYETLK